MNFVSYTQEDTFWTSLYLKCYPGVHPLSFFSHYSPFLSFLNHLPYLYLLEISEVSTFVQVKKNL